MSVSFTPLPLGISSAARAPARVALAVAPGRVEVIVPEDYRNRGRASVAPTSGRQRQEADYMAKLAGLHGVARVLAQDAGRRGASRVRTLAAEQAADVLREAGHRAAAVAAAVVHRRQDGIAG